MKPAHPRPLAFLAALFIAASAVLPGQVAPGAAAPDNLAQRKLFAAYHYLFYLLDRGAAIPGSAGPGLPLGNASRLNLGLSSSELAALAKAAREFRSEESSTQAQIERITRADLLSHSRRPGIGPLAEARIHSLFMGLEYRESDTIAVIHSALGAKDAARLDTVATSLLTAVKTWSPPPLRSPFSGSRSRSRTLASVQPDAANPPGFYCQDYPPEEWQALEDECDNEGGLYNIENCACTLPGDGGGGGGGSAPLLPTVTVSVTSSSVNYGAVPGPINAIVSYDQDDAPDPTGGVTFKITDTITDGPAPAVSSSGATPLELTPNPDAETASASVQWNLQTLGGGPVFGVSAEYQVTASYNGDENFRGTQSSTPALFEVNKAPVTVAITNCPASSTTVASGQPLSVAISVTWETAPTAESFSVATPSGQVIVSDAASASGTGGAAPISGQLKSVVFGTPSTATVSITPAGSGIQLVGAAYQGDGNYQTGTSLDCAITVAPAS